MIFSEHRAVRVTCDSNALRHNAAQCAAIITCILSITVRKVRTFTRGGATDTLRKTGCAFDFEFKAECDFSRNVVRVPPVLLLRSNSLRRVCCTYKLALLRHKLE